MFTDSAAPTAGAHSQQTIHPLFIQIVRQYAMSVPLCQTKQSEQMYKGGKVTEGNKNANFT